MAKNNKKTISFSQIRKNFDVILINVGDKESMSKILDKFPDAKILVLVPDKKSNKGSTGTKRDSQIAILTKKFDKFVEEQIKRWDEQEKRWEEQEKRWEEQSKRWEEQSKRWEEQMKFNKSIAKELTKINGLFIKHGWIKDK